MDGRGVELTDLEDALLMLQIFGILGRLHDVNPQLCRDCQEECWLSLKEKNNRTPTDRRFSQIAMDDLVRFVTTTTGADKQLAEQCASAATLPSKLQHVLEVCRAHEKAWRDMQRRQWQEKKAAKEKAQGLTAR